MRRQHAILAQLQEEVLRLVLERGQRVGIQHHGRLRRQNRADQFLRCAADANTGADDHAVQPLIFQQIGQSAGTGERLDHDGREMRGICRDRVLRARHAHQPCSHAQRSPRGKARGAGGMHRATHHHAMAARIFVRQRIGPWKFPLRGIVLEQVRRDRVHRTRGNADIGHDDLAAMKTPRHQHMRGFLAEEGDREIGVDAFARDGPAGVALHAAGHVDGDDGDGGFVQQRRQIGGRPFQRPRQARAKQRIHDQGHIVEDRGGERFIAAAEAFGHLRGVAFELVAAAQQREPHIPAALAQEPRDHEPVAAIVARPAQNSDRERRPTRLDRVGHRATGIFHQRQRRNAVRGGECVRFITLRDGEDFSGHRTR